MADPGGCAFDRAAQSLRLEMETRVADRAKRSRRLWYLWGACFCLCLTMLVRCVWLAAFPPQPLGPVDAEGFHLLAVNMLAGRGFAIGWEAPFCPTTIRPPLYPGFLALSYLLVGGSPWCVVLLQVLLEVLTTAWVFRLGCVLGGRRAGLVAALLYVFNASTQRYTGYLFAETLLLGFMSAALYFTVRFAKRFAPADAACCALLWGGALLTKPNIQFLVWGIGGLFSLVCLRRAFVRARSSSTRPALVALTLFWLLLGATLFPWLLRNRLLLGRWILSTAFEENIARVSAVATLAEVQSIDVLPWTETWEHIYNSQLVALTAERYAWSEPGLEYGLPCAVQAVRHAQLSAVAREVVSEHPQAYLRAHLRGVLRSVLDPGHRLWYPVVAGAEWESTGTLVEIWPRLSWSLERGALWDALQVLWSERVARPPLCAALLWWGLFLARVALGGLLLRGAWRLRRSPVVVLILLATVGYILLLPGPIAHDRFYLPAIPAVVVLAACGLVKRSSLRI